MMWVVKRDKLFIAVTKFVLQIYHKPLLHLNSVKFQNDRIMRWSLSLQDYDYQLEDIPVTANHLAGYMSRVTKRNRTDFTCAVYVVICFALCLLLVLNVSKLCIGF